MKKGTFTLLNVARLGPGSTTPFGTFVGLSQAKNVAIWFEGSYAASAGTAAHLDIYGAIAPALGSIDSTKIGSITIAKAATAVKRRIKGIGKGSTHLIDLPYIVCKAIHNTGTTGLHNVLAKAIVQHD